MIIYRCRCGQTLQVGDALAGCKARCPACLAAGVVPMAEDQEEIPRKIGSDDPTLSLDHDITVHRVDKRRPDQGDPP